jgi:hypothetical protein
MVHVVAYGGRCERTTPGRDPVEGEEGREELQVKWGCRWEDWITEGGSRKRGTFIRV